VPMHGIGGDGEDALPHPTQRGDKEGEVPKLDDQRNLVCLGLPEMHMLLGGE
jgi:hypothetical protein